MSDPAAVPDYKKHDPRGWCGDPSRGAALGRPTIKAAPKEAQLVLTVRRVHLDGGGYDANGTYFGRDKPLYNVAGTSDLGDDVDYMIRETCDENAEIQAEWDYPNAKIVMGPDIELPEGWDEEEEDEPCPYEEEPEEED